MYDSKGRTKLLVDLDPLVNLHCANLDRGSDELGGFRI